ncbi:hypothetical protein Ahy_B02g060151 [Arachis hypogaea]|uniref:Protein FAR1-RELATED SEQUENCE n=1 Tax=Arachis hypogaea TaxID=3818 RepID=A0A445AHY7_ARAHY|nr:hypothetical protein Ahy_B02g060151 [Arachis hypogaea]
MVTLIQDSWFTIKHEKDIGSTLKGTIGEESIGQLLMSTVGRGFDSFVTIERSEHNHPLCPPKYRHLIAANRGLDETDKTQADSLRACGVKTCHIMGYMVSQKGGYDKVGFTIKDLHNHISKTRRGKRWNEIISKYKLAENE